MRTPIGPMVCLSLASNISTAIELELPWALFSVKYERAESIPVCRPQVRASLANALREKLLLALHRQHPLFLFSFLEKGGVMEYLSFERLGFPGKFPFR